MTPEEEKRLYEILWYLFHGWRGWFIIGWLVFIIIMVTGDRP